jgi:hypothetical protein
MLLNIAVISRCFHVQVGVVDLTKANTVNVMEISAPGICQFVCNNDDPRIAAFPSYLKSQVSVIGFREFVSALEGMTVKVTNNNPKGLSQLCEEFLFRDLAGRHSQFRECGNLTEEVVLLLAQKERILALEEQMHHEKREVASLRRELSRVPESFEQRTRPEAA